METVSCVLCKVYIRVLSAYVPSWGDELGLGPSDPIQNGAGILHKSDFETVDSSDSGNLGMPNVEASLTWYEASEKRRSERGRKLKGRSEEGDENVLILSYCWRCFANVLGTTLKAALVCLQMSCQP